MHRLIKLLVSIVLTGMLSFAACLYMPWWSVSIVAGLVSVVIWQGPGWSFLSGFLAVFLLWIILSGYISNQNQDLLAHKMSLVILKADSPIMLILFSGLIGALVAGFGALAGCYLRMTFPVNNRNIAQF